MAGLALQVNEIGVENKKQEAERQGAALAGLGGRSR
jgi:hypothetical protein